MLIKRDLDCMPAQLAAAGFTTRLSRLFAVVFVPKDLNEKNDCSLEKTLYYEFLVNEPKPLSF